MVEIDIIRETQQRKFERISEKISKIYNEHTGLKESFRITEPDNIFVIHPKGVNGGIVVSKIYGYEKSATILVAAFKEEDRNKGYLKACVSEAQNLLKKNNLNLVTVTVNPDDNKKLWGKLGFNNEMEIRGLTHLATVPKSKLI